MLDILTQSPYYPTPTVDIVLTAPPLQPTRHTSTALKWRHREAGSAQVENFNFDDHQCLAHLNRPHSSIESSHGCHSQRKAVSQVFNIKQMKQPSPESSSTLEPKRTQGEHAQLIKTISLRVCDSAAIGQEEEEYRVSTSHSLRRKWKQHPTTQRPPHCYAFSQPTRTPDGTQSNRRNSRPWKELRSKVMERGWSEQRSRKTGSLKASQESFMQFSV